LGYSLDGGVTWHAAITNPFGGAENITAGDFGNNTFVVVSSAGNIAWSKDGKNWTLATVNPFGGTSINGVVFGNMLFMAAGNGGKIARSVDFGKTWTLMTSPTALGIQTIHYFFGIFEIVTSTNFVGSRSFDNGVTWSTTFVLPTLIYHMASSSTNVVAVLANGIVLMATWNAAFSSAPEQLYVPTFTGFGTVSGVNFSWRQIANRIKVMGKFTTGVVTAVEPRISLPFGMLSDSALIPSIEFCGMVLRNAFSATYFFTSCLIESGTGYIVFGRQSSGNAATNKVTDATTIFGNAELIMLQFEIPILGLNV
jgi:hypothetical protein